MKVNEESGIWCDGVKCGVVEWSGVEYGVVQCSVMQCSYVLHRAVLYCILYFGAVYCYIESVAECLLSDAFISVPHCTVRYSAAPFTVWQFPSS